MCILWNKVNNYDDISWKTLDDTGHDGSVILEESTIENSVNWHIDNSLN